jgi:hypothetical protein
MDVVEDEWHFLLECPTYNVTRNKYASLFDTINMAHGHNNHNLALTLSDADACVHTIMNHHDTHKLAQFLTDCLTQRTKTA